MGHENGKGNEMQRSFLCDLGGRRPPATVLSAYRQSCRFDTVSRALQRLWIRRQGRQRRERGSRRKGTCVVGHPQRLVPMPAPRGSLPCGRARCGASGKVCHSAAPAAEEREEKRGAEKGKSTMWPIIQLPTPAPQGSLPHATSDAVRTPAVRYIVVLGIPPK